MLMHRTVARGALATSALLAAASTSFASPAASAPPSRAFNTRTASGYAPSKKFRVGVLGATGAVGQRFVEALEGHPWFEVTALGASARSEGKAYEAATAWQLAADVPACARGKVVTACSPAAMPNVDLVFSALVRGGTQCGRVRAAIGRARGGPRREQESVSPPAPQPSSHATPRTRMSRAPWRSPSAMRACPSSPMREILGWWTTCLSWCRL